MKYMRLGYCFMVGCYRLSFGVNNQIYSGMDRYMACLVVKAFVWTYDTNYFETFSHIARLNSIHVIFYIAGNQQWPMVQLDVRNVFLYGDLKKMVNMEQPSGMLLGGGDSVKFKKAIYGLGLTSLTEFSLKLI